MEREQIFKCMDCGMIVEVVNPGTKGAECPCGNVKAMVENTVDAAKEKHVPVVEAQGDGILVKVGEVPHPMEEDHYIEWIEVINGSYVTRCYLKPGDAPQASFYVPMQPGLIVREYCNKHGLWKK